MQKRPVSVCAEDCQVALQRVVRQGADQHRTRAPLEEEDALSLHRDQLPGCVRRPRPKPPRRVHTHRAERTPVLPFLSFPTRAPQGRGMAMAKGPCIGKRERVRENDFVPVPAGPAVRLMPPRPSARGCPSRPCRSRRMPRVPIQKAGAGPGEGPGRRAMEAAMPATGWRGPARPPDRRTLSPRAPAARERALSPRGRPLQAPNLSHLAHLEG